MTNVRLSVLSQPIQRMSAYLSWEYNADEPDLMLDFFRHDYR